MSPEDLVSAQFTALENGDAALAARCLHPEHVNHMAADEPPACARPGVPGFLATSAWLRLAFPDLRFELIEMAVEGDRAIAHLWMRGTQAGEHIAVRDDLGMMTQLGHLPPGPAAIARMARFQLSGQAKRAVTHAIEVAAQAADRAAAADPQAAGYVPSSEPA
jgi:ketosteroid isomerase-like protein